MPQSPKQRLSPAQEGLFRKETWEVSLRQRAAPAAGHGGTGNAPFPPAAAVFGGQEEGAAARSNSVNGWHTHTLRISGWFGYHCYQTTKSSENGQILWLCGRDVSQSAHPRQKGTSGNWKSVILENDKWCSKSRAALCQQWELTKKKLESVPPQRGNKRDSSLLTLIQATRWRFHLPIFRKISMR